MYIFIKVGLVSKLIFLYVTLEISLFEKKNNGLKTCSSKWSVDYFLVSPIKFLDQNLLSYHKSDWSIFISIIFPECVM